MKLDETLVALTRTINCFALNQQKSLMLVQEKRCISRSIDSYINHIYTVEGYLVTSFGYNKQFRYRYETSLATFNDDLIVCLAKVITNSRLWLSNVINIIIRYNQYNIRERRLSDKRDAMFLDCDKNGNIYTVDKERNSISLYNSDLEFTRTLQFPGTEGGVIISICIRDNLLVVLENKKTDVVKEQSYSYAIHKICLSTGEHIEKVSIENPQFINPNKISLDNKRNIFIYKTSRNNLDQHPLNLALLYHSGTVRYMSIPDIGDCYKTLKNKEQMELAITENFQLIRVLPYGCIFLYNIT